MTSVLLVLTTLKKVLNNLKRQHAFLENYILPILTEAADTNDGSLTDQDFRKITSYYGLAVPAILGEAFCILHSKEFTSTERITLTAQGAMTGLFDDFFDQNFLDNYVILQKVHGTNGTASNEKLFHFFYQKALESSAYKKEITTTLENVYHAQVLSKKQTGYIDENEIYSITIQKGGASLLFYRAGINAVCDQQEEKILFTIGALMQLCNDIFDVFKDRETGVKTLVTECKSIASLETTFDTLLKDILSQLKLFPGTQKCKIEFLAIISLSVFSRAMIALDQLSAIQNGNKEIDMYKLSRIQMICDMDTISNKIKSLGKTSAILRRYKKL